MSLLVFPTLEQMLAGENREQQEVIPVANMSGDYVETLKQKVTGGMKLGLTAGSESNPNVFSAAGTHEVSQVHGASYKDLCLFRMSNRIAHADILFHGSLETWSYGCERKRF